MSLICEPQEYWDRNETEGAVDLSECLYRSCRCGACSLCGAQKHTAIHGPYYRQPPGSKPYGHKFQSNIQRAAPAG